MVDETPCNGLTDYNSTTVVGNRDSYGVDISTIPNGATITKIELVPCAARAAPGGGNPTINVFYRLNGTDSADAGAYALTGTTPSDLATTSFSGLSIVKSATTTLEDGVVLTSGNKGARLSRIAMTITYTALTAPSGASDLATTSSQIRVSWTDNSTNDTGFTIERSLDAANWNSVATTTASTTSYYDLGLSANTVYYHRVRAYNVGGYSGYSNVASATTTDNPPSAPSNLTLTTQPGVGTTTDVLLQWNDNSSNELGFLVERKINTGGFLQIATTSIDAVSYTDASRTTGTYTYRVRAYGSGGTSSYSNTASTTVQ
jgi:hypothetical protein